MAGTQGPAEEGDPSAGSCVLCRADEPDDDLTYVQVTCLVCAQAHLVNPKTREVLGAGDEKTRGALRSHNARQDDTEPSPFSGSSLKSGVGVVSLKLTAGGRGPHWSVANARGQTYATLPSSQACRQNSRRTTKFVLLDHALVGLVGVLDAILENPVFWRQ
jgi:hypothetical protein